MISPTTRNWKTPYLDVGIEEKIVPLVYKFGHFERPKSPLEALKLMLMIPRCMEDSRKPMLALLSLGCDYSHIEAPQYSMWNESTWITPRNWWMRLHQSQCIIYLLLYKEDSWKINIYNYYYDFLLLAWVFLFLDYILWGEVFIVGNKVGLTWVHIWCLVQPKLLARYSWVIGITPRLVEHC